MKLINDRTNRERPSSFYKKDSYGGRTRVTAAAHGKSLAANRVKDTIEAHNVRKSGTLSKKAHRFSCSYVHEGGLISMDDSRFSHADKRTLGSVPFALESRSPCSFLDEPDPMFHFGLSSSRIPFFIVRTDAEISQGGNFIVWCNQTLKKGSSRVYRKIHWTERRSYTVDRIRSGENDRDASSRWDITIAPVEERAISRTFVDGMLGDKWKSIERTAVSKNLPLNGGEKKCSPDHFPFRPALHATTATTTTTGVTLCSLYAWPSPYPRHLTRKPPPPTTRRLVPLTDW